MHAQLAAVNQHNKRECNSSAQEQFKNNLSGEVPQGSVIGPLMF